MKTAFLILCAAGCAGAGSLPVKISGIGHCGSVEARQTVDVGDRPDHTVTISKSSCTWVTSFTMAGIKAVSYTVAVSTERSGDQSQERAYLVIAMENGDKAFTTLQGDAKYVNGKIASRSGTWIYTGGTGKFAGLQGKGSYKVIPTGDTQVDGEYTLPSQ